MMHLFTLYDLKHNYIGKTHAATPKDAVSLMIMHYLKYRLTDSEINLKLISEKTFLVTTKAEKFFLKQKDSDGL